MIPDNDIHINILIGVRRIVMMSFVNDNVTGCGKYKISYKYTTKNFLLMYCHPVSKEDGWINNVYLTVMNF